MKNCHPKRKSCKFIDATDEILKSYNTIPRRSRIKLTDEQLFQLENKFSECHHPSSSAKDDLSKLLDIPVKNVQIWFHNRRAREKAEREDLQIKYEKRRNNNIANNYLNSSYLAQMREYERERDAFYEYMERAEDERYRRMMMDNENEVPNNWLSYRK